jgi:hypothetical protein
MSVLFHSTSPHSSYRYQLQVVFQLQEEAYDKFKIDVKALTSEADDNDNAWASVRPTNLPPHHPIESYFNPLKPLMFPINNNYVNKRKRNP